MTERIPFVGLAPDSRRVRGGGDVMAFDAIRVGSALRRARCQSTADVAATLAEIVGGYEHGGRPAWILVRVFTVRGGEAAVIASRGIEPNVEAAPKTSMLDRALAELRFDAPASTFYVEEAGTVDLGSAYVVHSVVGFGAAIAPGENVMLLAYCRATLPSELRYALETLAFYTRLAWIESDPALADLRAGALDALVTHHETTIRDAFARTRLDVDAIRKEAARVAADDAAKLEAQHRKMQRTQRAMLNVIDDLREARVSLESKVAARTRELALRNRDLEEFVYIASHDLQEPLRTVAGYLQMIERRYAAKLGPDGDEFIRFAIDGAQRMQALIESLLVYSRVATKEKAFERTPLDDVLDAALKNLALRIEETQATVERAPLPVALVDRVQMVQLFQNLIANALKFSGDKPPRIRVSGELANGTCVIRVRDEGIGFNPKFVDRIFKLFRRLRRDTPGTGIGLAVCKKIAERHGGHIEAQSTPGEGSTFTVHFAPVPQVEREDP